MALHPVCSLTKMNLVPKLEGVAQACADKVVVPRDAVAGIPVPYAEEMLDNTYAIISTVVTTDDVLAAWD